MSPSIRRPTVHNIYSHIIYINVSAIPSRCIIQATSYTEKYLIPNSLIKPYKLGFLI